MDFNYHHFVHTVLILGQGLSCTLVLSLGQCPNINLANDGIVVVVERKREKT